MLQKINAGCILAERWQNDMITSDQECFEGTVLYAYDRMQVPCYLIPGVAGRVRHMPVMNAPAVKLVIINKVGMVRRIMITGYIDGVDTCDVEPLCELVKQ